MGSLALAIKNRWCTSAERYRERAKIWKEIPRSSLVILMFFIFLLFGTVGLLGTITDFHRIPVWLLATVVLFTGVFAIGYAYVSVRIHWKWIFAIMPFQFLMNWWVNYELRLQPNLGANISAELVTRLTWTTIIAIVFLVASYTLALVFMGKEGKRYFRVHAEVQLAAEIHRALVPPLELRAGEFEIYGISLPSGEVGGDLVDAVVRDGNWIAYVADVSGHGVSSGVLMAMLKSATRMGLRKANTSATNMLNDVNDVFYTLKAPNAFATFASVSCTERGLEVIVAGHLPILHCDGKQVTELDTPGLPLGILPAADFRAAEVELKTGELLAIVTDGLTEVFAKNGDELGVDYVKRTMVGECGRPLPQIATSLMRQAREYGPRSDDQSLLLVRRM